MVLLYTLMRVNQFTSIYGAPPMHIPSVAMLLCMSVTFYTAYYYMTHGVYGLGLLATALLQVALWVSLLSSPEGRDLSMMVPPVNALYGCISWISIFMMGSNTAAQLAREEQLRKLEHVQ